MSVADAKPKLYVFEGATWPNVAKLAQVESGWKAGDVEWVRIDLAEGANFEPEYLKVNGDGTLPTLVIDGKTFPSSTEAARELIQRGPHPPTTHAHTSTSIIEEIHAEAHDSNATLLFARDDKDRESKINGIPKAFLEGRQKKLDELVKNPPSEFKQFLEEKQKFNQGLLDFYAGNPTDEQKKQHYAQAAELWKSVGIVIRGVITQALLKNDGPFAAGPQPGEVDFHIITWLSRTITNTGLEPNSPASVAIPKLQEYTGGHGFDPVIGKYWDAWLARDSFKRLNIH